MHTYYSILTSVQHLIEAVFFFSSCLNKPVLLIFSKSCLYICCSALFSFHPAVRMYCFQQCPFVTFYVSQYDKSRTVRDIVTKFSGHHAVVIREAKFKNCYIGICG